MKIVYLTNLPSPYRVEFFNELVRGGIELTVLYERHQASDRDEKWKSKEEVLFREIYLKSKAIKGERSISVDAIKYINILDYDIFIVHGYSTVTAMIAIEYLRLKRIPFVISADGGMVGKSNLIKDAVKKHFIGSASAWLSTGKTTTEYFCHYGAKKKCVFVYPFSSIKNDDVNKPSTIEEKELLRKKLNIKEKKVVLFVGQYIYRKGIDILLDTARRLGDLGAGIYLVGGQPGHDLLKTVKEYKLDNIHFVPFKEKWELQDYYRVADVFTLPTREDIWGLVINEAMGQGLPVVSTNRCVAALTMVEDDKSGYIVETDDSDSLFDRISILLNDLDKRNQFSNKSYMIAKSYTIENMAKIHIKIFNKLGNLSAKKRKRKKR